MTRIGSAIGIIALVAAAMYLGGWYFYGFIILALSIGLKELLRTPAAQFCIPQRVQWALIASFIAQAIAHIFVPTLTIYLLFMPFFGLLIYGMFQRDQLNIEQLAYAMLCYLYVLIPAIAGITLAQNSMWLIILVGFIASGTDTGAYFAGVFFGKHKLAPEISPKKTIEGSIGGTLVGTGLAMVVFPLLVQQFAPTLWETYAPLFSGVPFFVTTAIVISLSVATQFGDLVASSIKRQYGIKDFGNLFPGHGGIMDRVDGIIIVFVFLALFVEVSHLYL